MNSLPQRSTDFELTTSQDGFALSWQQRLILRHSTENTTATLKIAVI